MYKIALNWNSRYLNLVLLNLDKISKQRKKEISF